MNVRTTSALPTYCSVWTGRYCKPTTVCLAAAQQWRCATGNTANRVGPGADDTLCGIATLTPIDMATSKLLANADRGVDDGVFSRDLIDLAMMAPPLPLLRQAVAKAEQAYGASVCRDLDKAIARMRERQGWLERCMKVLDMDIPRALLWQKIRTLRRVLPP